jgi:hypothetical protein
MDKSYVKLFYVVTMNSIFLVKDNDERGCPYVEIIATKSDDKMAVGQCLKGGNLVVIFYVLSVTTAEKYDYFKKSCDPEHPEDRVRIKYLGGHSSNIVALFKTEDEAQQCFTKTNLQQCDPRWLTQTKQVLMDIGPDHPNFKIATADYRLIRD